MKYRNKKAISPLIATVLVIGFTIVLAGVVMQFLIPLFTSSTEQSKADAALMNKCGQFSTALTIKTAKYEADKLSVVVDNPTVADIEYLVLKYYTTDGSGGSCKLLAPNDDILGATPALKGGGLLAMTVNATGGLAPSAEPAIFDTNCQIPTGSLINKVEITPAIFMKETKETKPCGSAVVSATVY